MFGVRVAYNVISARFTVMAEGLGLGMGPGCAMTDGAGQGGPEAADPTACGTSGPPSEHEPITC